MKLRTIFISIVLILTAVKIKAQNYELGEVTIAELEEKAHPKDTTAPAAILFKKGETSFSYSSGSGFTTLHVYEFRIKIYKTGGLSWANQEVLCHVDDNVRFSNAVTYNLEDGRIVKTKLRSEGVFKSKINEFRKKVAITLPNVKAGSIIDFKYVLESRSIIRLPDFDFQYDIPVNYFEYKTEIPEFLIYKTLLVGGIEIQVNTELEDSRQSFAYGFQQINRVYKAQNIPALKSEEFVDNIGNYKGSIKSELQRKRFPDEPVVEYTTSWEEVAATIYKHDAFGKEIKLKDYFLEDLNRLLLNVNSKGERLSVIFNFVQNKMNWNKNKGYYVDIGVKKAYQTNTGNVAEINFILISMLKNAGIDASPVLVSTIENGIPVFPNLTVFNYVIAAAEINGHKILLDATNKLTTLNVLPLNLLNWKGRLIKEDGFSEEIEMIPAVPSKNDYSLDATINPVLGKIEGKLRMTRTEYSAFTFRERNSVENEDNYLEKLENDLNRIEIKDYEVENKSTNLSDPVLETFNFVTDNQSETIGDKIFINPLLFFTRSKNPFIQEKRQMAIYFGYPSQEKINLSLEIPEGYVVESMPKPVRISSEDKKIVFVLNIFNDQNKIQITSSREINKSTFAADEYEVLKNLFQKAIISQNEKIVLKKI